MPRKEPWLLFVKKSTAVGLAAAALVLLLTAEECSDSNKGAGESKACANIRAEIHEAKQEYDHAKAGSEKQAAQRTLERRHGVYEKACSGPIPAQDLPDPNPTQPTAAKPQTARERTYTFSAKCEGYTLMKVWWEFDGHNEPLPPGQHPCGGTTTVTRVKTTWPHVVRIHAQIVETARVTAKRGSGHTSARITARGGGYPDVDTGWQEDNGTGRGTSPPHGQAAHAALLPG